MFSKVRKAWMRPAAKCMPVILALAMLAGCAPAPTAAPTTAPANTAPPPTVAVAATQAPVAAPTVAATTAPAAAPTAAPTVAPTAAPKPTTAPSGAAGTVVIVKNIDDIVSFDPAEGYEFSDWLGIHAEYDTLVKFEGADLTTVKPSLATKWDIKDAGATWDITFALKDGVKFASGNPFTSADVVYSFQRGIALNKPPAFLWTDIGGLKAESIKAPDAKTVVLSLPKTASAPEFLNVLTAPPMSIVDSVEVQKHVTANDFGNAWLKDHSAGSGPYMMDHWTKSVEFLIKANPNAATAPKTAAVLVKHVPEAANQQAQLDKGDVDIAFDLTPEIIKAETGKAGISTMKAGNLQIFYVGMNVAMKPLDNNNVREALRMAIDYKGITDDLLSGNAQGVQSIVPIGLFGANTDKPFQKDVAGAKKKLADAGFPNGFTMDMLTLTGNQGIVPMGDLGAKIQADWAEIGVKVNVKQQAAAELLASYRAQKAPIVILLWGPDFPDPDANGTPFSNYDAKSIAWRNSWTDATAIAKSKAAALETDPTKRAAAYKDLTDYVAHNGPYAVLFQPNQLFALRSNVQGFTWNPGGVSDLWTISK